MELLDRETVEDAVLLGPYLDISVEKLADAFQRSSSGRKRRDVLIVLSCIDHECQQLISMTDSFLGTFRMKPGAGSILGRLSDTFVREFTGSRRASTRELFFRFLFRNSWVLTQMRTPLLPLLRPNNEYAVECWTAFLHAMLPSTDGLDPVQVALLEQVREEFRGGSMGFRRSHPNYERIALYRLCLLALHPESATRSELLGLHQEASTEGLRLCVDIVGSTGFPDWEIKSGSLALQLCSAMKGNPDFRRDILEPCHQANLAISALDAIYFLLPYVYGLRLRFDAGVLLEYPTRASELLNAMAARSDLNAADRVRAHQVFIELFREGFLLWDPPLNKCAYKLLAEIVTREELDQVIRKLDACDASE